MRNEDRSKTHIVHSDVEVKSWIERMPSVSEVRPASCPRCEVASRPLGEPLRIWGHGMRARQIRGPLAPEELSRTVVISVRRYLCRVCTALITVVPRGVVARRHYGGAAIGWALALFGVAKRALAQVRRRVSAWPVVGATASASWATLIRWTRAVRAGRLFSCVRSSPAVFTARQVAERAATTLAAHAPPGSEGDVCTRAFAGGARMA